MPVRFFVDMLITLNCCHDLTILLYRVLDSTSLSTVALWFADLTNLLVGGVIVSEAPHYKIQPATCPLPNV